MLAPYGSLCVEAPQPEGVASRELRSRLQAAGLHPVAVEPLQEGGVLRVRVVAAFYPRSNLSA